MLLGVVKASRLLGSISSLEKKLISACDRVYIPSRSDISIIIFVISKTKALLLNVTAQ